MNLVNVLKRVLDFNEEWPNQVESTCFYRSSSLKKPRINGYETSRYTYFIADNKIVNIFDREDCVQDEDIPDDYPEFVIVDAIPFSIEDLTANDWNYEY